MNRLLPYIFLIVSCFAFSQEDALPVKVQELKRNINQTKGTHKLKLLDSLCEITLNNPEFKYDSIAKVTYVQAIELNDINLATKHLAKLLYYLNYRIEKPKEGLELFQDYIKNDRIVTDTLALAKLYLEGADIYLNSGFENQSLDWYDKTTKTAINAKDSSLYAKAKGYKAYALTKMGDYVTASKEYQKALMFFLRRKDSSNIIKIKNGLALIYGQNKFYKECEKELNEVEKMTLALNDIPTYIITLGNKASNYFGQKKYKESIEGNKKKLQLISQYPRFKSMEASSLKMLVLSYLETDSLHLAKKMLKRLEAKLNPSDLDFGLKRKYTEALVRVCFAEKKYLKAKNTALNMLEMLDKSSYYSLVMDTNNMLFQIEEKLGNSKSALNYHKQYIKIKDSIESIEKSNGLAYYQTLYETEKRDFKIADQASEISLLDAKNKLSRQWMLFGGIGLLALFSIIYLTRSRKFVVSKQELQEQFSQDLINEQERERAHLARELHDSVGQKLMLLSRQTKTMGNSNMENLADSTLDEIRSISRGLHPSNLERLGLTEAINALVYDINVNTDLFFTDEIENIDHILSKESELHLYRIIQETLSNIVKHAEAKAVKMQINKTDKEISLLVSDNGKGFNIESKKNVLSLGMKTLFERAKIINSNLDLKSSLGKGTKITLNIPIQV